MDHVLQSAAITFIIVRSGIFRWLRELGPKGWREFVSCPLCTGFWVGLGVALARAVFEHQVPWNREELHRFWSDTAGEFALELVGTGALVGAVALLFTCAIDWMDATERRARGELPPKD